MSQAPRCEHGEPERGVHCQKCKQNAGGELASSTGYLAHWRYSDGSGSGVLPKILTKDDVSLLKLADEHFGFTKTVEYVEAR